MALHRQTAVVSLVLVLWSSLVAPARGADAPQSGATPADALTLPPGFKIELLYSVPGGEQGSWVNITFDPKGRLITSDQYGLLYRVTIDKPAKGKVQVERLTVQPKGGKPMGGAHGMCFAFDSLYVVVGDGGAGTGNGLYRLRDTNNDDHFDEVKLLRKLEGGGEHGPHAVIPTPDGKGLFIVGGNHTKLPNPEKSLQPRNWDEDQLLPRMPDAGGHAVDIRAPGGWVCRTDPDGKTFELFCSGFRNMFDLAVNRDGELFTFDSDMEWDIGLPWYRPTAAFHLVSGGEYGWRTGSGVWPQYYPDALPAAVAVGPGSPTGITFGYGAKFPAKYQEALYLCDWSWGNVYAAHLGPDGASYTGEYEKFITGQPFPVTDVMVGPDGAMYITIGGRKTQSGLYRVTYAGGEATAPAKTPARPREVTEAVKLRKKLEAFHGREDPKAVAAAWPHLGSADRFVRFAARTAVEHQPVAQWRAKALDPALGTKSADAAISALLALARCSKGDTALLPKLVEAINRLDYAKQTPVQQLELVRLYGVAFARFGRPDPATAASVVERLDKHFPAGDFDHNRELSALLCYLQAPGGVQRVLELQAKAPTQEEAIWYAYVLRGTDGPWTMEQRKTFFDYFNRAIALKGGHSFAGYIGNMRTEAVAKLTDEEKTALADVLSGPRPTGEGIPSATPDPKGTGRKFVKEYKVEDLLPVVQKAGAMKGRNYQNGRAMFSVAACFNCHRIGGEGGFVGPDLTAVASRYGPKDMLEAILEPSKVVSDQYQQMIFTLKDGKRFVGRVVNLNGDNFMVAPSMLAPDQTENVNRHQVESIKPAKVSPMPTNLLDAMDEEEILDLLAYLYARGDPKDEAFRKPAAERQ